MPHFVVYIAVNNPRPRRVQERVEIEAESAEAAIALAKAQVAAGGFEVVQTETDTTFAVELGSTKHYPIPLDIFELEKMGAELPTEGNGYCTGYSREYPDRKTYTDWEDEVASPAMIKAGFEQTWCWYDGERDSFGPLSRVTTATKEGKFYEISYG